MANSASSTRRLPTAKELGIPMPNPSIMPLVCATGVVVMFCGLLFLKNTATGVSIMLLGAVWWVVALYNWLTTPLEDAH
jgi:cytochrome c oxidase subunit 1